MLRKLVKVNLIKSIYTSIAVLLLILLSVFLSFTCNLLKEGFKRIYLEKMIQTNSADSAIVLPADYYSKNVRAISKRIESNSDIKQFEAIEAIVLKRSDIECDGEIRVNGTWIVRNSNRLSKMSKFEVVEKLEKIPEQAIYIPYVCKSYFGLQLGDLISIGNSKVDRSYIIAGFTEDVLFGSKSSLAFDLPNNEFNKLKELLAGDSDSMAMIISVKGENPSKITDYLFNCVGADELNFLMSSDVDYARSSRIANMSIYMAIMSTASIIVLISCFGIIGFQLQNEFKKNRKEIGTLKAIGYRGITIIFSYVMQYVFLGVVGAILGIVISQISFNAVAAKIANDIGFIWKSNFMPDLIIYTLIRASLIIGIMTVVFSRKIFFLKPVESFGNAEYTEKGKQKSISIIPFSLNLSIVLQMINSEKIKSIFISLIFSCIICISGLSVILYVRLVSDKDGLLQITGAEPYTVNIQVGHNGIAKVDEVISTFPEVTKKMVAVEAGTLQLLCDEVAYGSLTIFNDYSLLENPTIYQGRYPEEEYEIAVSGNLLKKLGKHIGDEVSVSKPYEREETKQTYVITGLTQGTYTGGMDVYLTIDGIHRIDPGIEWGSFHIYLKQGTDINSFIDSVRSKIGKNIIYIGNYEEMFTTQFSSVIKSVSGMVYLVIGVMFIVTVIIVFYITNSILSLRTYNFAIMKVLGYSNAQIMKQVAMNFIVYISLGGILGEILLLFESNTVIKLIFQNMGVQKINFRYPLLNSLILIFFIGAVAYITALLSAFKIREMNACEILSNDV
jgi:putative ABC transport system permease protein